MYYQNDIFAESGKLRYFMSGTVGVYFNRLLLPAIRQTAEEIN